MDREVLAETIVGVQEEVRVDLGITSDILFVFTVLHGSAFAFSVGTRAEGPDVVEFLLDEVGHISTATGDELQTLRELETEFGAAVDAVVRVGGVVVIKGPPRVLGIRSVEVVSVVQDVLPVTDIGIVDVHRILEDILIDGGTAAALAGHRIADILADVVDAVVEPGETFLDLRVATEGEVVSLVVVVLAREDTIGIDVSIGSDETGVLAATLDRNRIVGLKTGGVEVLQGILLIREVRVILRVLVDIVIVAGVVTLLGGTRTPDDVTAVQKVTPGTVLSRRIVVKDIAVIGVEPALTETILDVRNTEDAAHLEGTVVGNLHGLVLLTALGGDDDGAVTGTGTVESGSGRTLEDGDGLDVLRVDISGLVTKVDGVVQVLGTHGAVGNRNTVDHIQRSIAGEGGVASDNDLLGGTGTTGGGNLDTGDLTGKTGESVSGVALEDFLGTDRGGSITEGLFLAGHTGRGDDHFVQADRVLFHPDIDFTLVVHRNNDITHAEEGELHDIATAHVERVSAVGVRHCTYVSAFNKYGDTRHGITVRIGHGTRDLPVLRVKGHRQDSQKARQKQFYFFHKHKLWLNINID